MKAPETKQEVIEQAREFLVSKAEGGTITFQMETTHALYFDSEFEGLKEEIKIEKEDGLVSNRLLGKGDWNELELEWTGYRVCTHCKCLMISGYVIDGGLEYFCSSYHLHKYYTAEEFTAMYDDGNSETYYTDWENES
jgi:hypothetical protein